MSTLTQQGHPTLVFKGPSSDWDWDDVPVLTAVEAMATPTLVPMPYRYEVRVWKEPDDDMPAVFVSVSNSGNEPIYVERAWLYYLTGGDEATLDFFYLFTAPKDDAHNDIKQDGAYATIPQGQTYVFNVTGILNTEPETVVKGFLHLKFHHFPNRYIPII